MRDIVILRRPPTIQLQDEPFVPRDVDLDDVEGRWEALCEANPAYFDGRVCHVIGVHRNGHGGAVVHVADCAYRFWAVQDATCDLGVQPLGVKGLSWRDGRILLGRRATNVARYGGMWEFAPGGGVEPGVDPVEVVSRELYEETGLRPARPPIAAALVFDEPIRTWEIVYRIEIEAGADEPPTSEYSELRWCTPQELPSPMSPIGDRMRSLL